MKAFSPLSEYYPGQVDSVYLLGYGAVRFTQNAQGLTIDLPESRTNAIAPAFRITTTEDKRSEYEQLLSIVKDMEALCKEYKKNCSPVNTGAYNTEKVNALAEKVEAAKNIDGNNEAAVGNAKKEIASAYQEFEKDGINQGGLFNGSIKETLNTTVLVESDNFSGTLGGRYGTLDNWTVENYNIANSSDGNRQGLDNYNSMRGISLGIWNDKGGNQSGDLSNARIYRKVTLPKGTYYFGAAYNSLYGLNNDAYMFVSKELCATEDIPLKSMAYYQVNKSKEGNDLYGLYVDIENETDVYIGWQANLDNGSETQEFRAVLLGFYLLDNDSKPVTEKLQANGWSKMERLDYRHF